MIALDKQAHFWAGMAISAGFVAYGASPLVAFVVATMVAAGKELWDKMGHGTPDKWDFVVTVIGAAVVLPLEFIPS